MIDNHYRVLHTLSRNLDTARTRPACNLGTCMLQEQTPDARDAQKRSEILQAIDEIVQTGLPDYPGLCIKPYGSYVSGLYCPSGDLDLSVEGIPTGG